MKLMVAGCFLFGVIASSQAQTTAEPINVYDGFESPTLSDLWEMTRTVPGAVTLQSDIVRAGHGALRVDLHARDRFSVGKDGDPDNERDEVGEVRRLFSNEDKLYEYSWSMYLPPDFPIVPVRLVVAQWKQQCISGVRKEAQARLASGTQAPAATPAATQSEHVPCGNDSPVLAVRYIGGVLRITRALGDTKITLWEEKRDLRGRWLDLRVQARFTPGPSGRVKVWLDGKQVLDYTGATANPESPATGYLSPSIYYFKFGLYRDVMPQSMTAYFDEYRKRELPAER